MVQFGVWKPPKTPNFEKNEFWSFVMVPRIPKYIWGHFGTFFTKSDFFLENLLPPWEFSMARFGVWKPPKAQNYEKK